MNRGFNVARQLTGGSGINNIAQQQRDSLQSGPAPLLQRAVVVDVIYDPNSLTNEQMDTLENSVINPELIEGMPFNSILARVITNSQDLSHPDIHVFYPMFPSHLQLPIKAGEQVLIMYEDYFRTGNSVGYWLTRPSAARQIEDINYTHQDRVFDPNNHPRNMDSNTLNSLHDTPPEFPNGAGTPETFSLRPSGSTNPYNDIVQHANATVITTFEPVPRLKKRPGDFTIQGSNNSIIILGQDRTGPALRVTGSEGKDIIEKAGTIDLIAGLGAPRKLPENENRDPSEGTYNPTSPRVIQNIRNNKEVNKTPYKNRKTDNPKEGDPDFKRDLSRIYLSMKTKGDKNFLIKTGGDSGIFPNSGGSNKLITQIEDLSDDNQNGQPFVITKSEHIRMIATGKDENNGPAENGDIRVIKEGTINNKDLSMFIMNKDGEIIAIGKNIQLYTHENGKVFIRCKGDGDEDSMVLYSKLEITLNKIIDGIANLTQKTADGFGGIVTGLTGQVDPYTTVPNPFLANTLGHAADAQIQLGQLKASEILTLKSNNGDNAKIRDIPSKWIKVNKTGVND